MAEAKKARAVGFNHVALEVGDIEETLAFYGRLFEFKLRGKSGTSASSIWATNSSHCRKAELNRLTSTQESACVACLRSSTSRRNRGSM